MVIVPNSRIRLLKSPIELDERNQLTFSNVTAQTNYFMSLPYLEYDNCTYQRKEGVIRYETEPNGITYEDLLGYNYCMYQNTAYDNKWFYAFITDCKYINDGMTELKIETDVIETWKFEINYKKSFIEREHTNDDSFGANLIPEDLDFGELVNASAPVSTAVGLHYYICVMSTKDIGDGQGGISSKGCLINGIYNGLNYAFFEDQGNYNADVVANKYINYFSTSDGLDMNDVIGVFMCPKNLLGNNKVTRHLWKSGDTDLYFYEPSSSTSAVQLEDYIVDDNFAMAGGYTPRNNKLLCYPYRYLLATNNSGATVVYKYEYFVQNITVLGINNIHFKTYGDISQGCSMRCVPQNYKSVSNDNYIESIPYSKYPIGAWVGDSYTNWLTQNALNMKVEDVKGTLKMVAGGIQAYKGNAVEGLTNAASGFADIAQVEIDKYNHEFMPSQANGNLSVGDVSFSLGLNNIYFYKMSITPYYSSILDDYFDMFGYKTHKVKYPNIEGRSNWNYVKTIGLNITGDIPQADMQKIKDIFDNGITFWHNPSTFLDYSQSNTIIS